MHPVVGSRHFSAHQPVSILLVMKSSLWSTSPMYSTVVRMSPRMDSSLRATCCEKHPRIHFSRTKLVRRRSRLGNWITATLRAGHVLVGGRGWTNALFLMSTKKKKVKVGEPCPGQCLGKVQPLGFSRTLRRNRPPRDNTRDTKARRVYPMHPTP